MLRPFLTTSLVLFSASLLMAEDKVPKTPKAKTNESAVVTPADQLTLLPGFIAEIIYNVPNKEQGSWVSLTTDPKGRLIASDQYGSLYRITPCASGASNTTTKVEKINVEIGAAHGLLWAYNSLFVMVNDTKDKKIKRGIYRVDDSDGNDDLDKVTLIKEIDGGGEHGPHGLALGPDGLIYMAIGNLTKLPEPFDAYPAGKNWQEDILLPRHWDPKGHAKGKLAPGGIITRIDKDGKKWELVSIGYRNAYDIAFNPQGDLFSYDSDMEWDMGTPWYRPTRATHNPIGADFGWRSGSGNNPAWHSDSLPPLFDIGPGSPVGVTFGSGAKFPGKYQKALYVLDWTYGTMYALHLEAKGASYSAIKEEFAFAKPWPLTDAIIGTDGAMYVTVGGRGTQSGIYRITYTGKEATALVKPAPPTPEALLRHEFETALGQQDPSVIKKAWPYLSNADRFLRFSARLAIEQQPVATWQHMVFSEKNPQGRISALTALARCGDKSLLGRACETWLELDLTKLDIDMQLEAMRACSLLITRMGQPDSSTALRMAAKIDPLFPSSDYRLNREVSSLLAVLGSPTVISKVLNQMLQDESAPQNKDLERLIGLNDRYGGTLARMIASKPVTQRLHYANALSVVKTGWTPDQRHAYFTWFEMVQKDAQGGNSFQGFVKAIRDAAWANVPEGERAALDPKKLSVASVTSAPVAPLPQPKGPGREWTVALAAPLAQSLHGRNYMNGKAMFQAAQCTICHRFAGEGAGVGPDLTSVGTKFSARDLLESIIEPSKVISDQYQSSMYMTKTGSVFIGKSAGEEDGQLLIMTNPLDASQMTKVNKADIENISPVRVSTMPPSLLNRLNQDEMLDLLAYMISGGNEKDKVFSK